MISWGCHIDGLEAALLYVSIILSSLATVHFRLVSMGPVGALFTAKSFGFKSKVLFVILLSKPPQTQLKPVVFVQNVPDLV